MLTILVVEDDDSKRKKIIEVIDDSLVDEVHEVTLAATVFDAGQALKAKHFDVLILDVRVPLRPGEPPRKDGGANLLQQLQSRKEYSAPTHVVGLTAYEDSVAEFASLFEDFTWVLIHYDAVDKELSAFSDRIDSMIDEAKTKWIQIKSEEHEEGLFDFEFSPEQLASLYLEFGHIDDVDDFVTLSLHKLKDRAEHNLAIVRRAIRTDLRTRLISSLNDLERNVAAIPGVPRQVEFSAAIGHCRTETQQELDLIAGWFDTVGDTAVPDFELRHVVETSIEMLRRTSANHHFTPIVDVATTWRLKGSTFAYFVDMFHILLANAVKHSPLQEVTVRIDNVDDRARITVTNALSPEVDLIAMRGMTSLLESRANGAHSGGEIRREGGSGYFKLGKIARIDLAQLGLAFSVGLDDGELNQPARFRASLTFDAEQVQ